MSLNLNDLLSTTVNNSSIHSLEHQTTIGGSSSGYQSLETPEYIPENVFNWIPSTTPIAYNASSHIFSDRDPVIVAVNTVLPQCQQMFATSKETKDDTMTTATNLSMPIENPATNPSTPIQNPVTNPSTPIQNPVTNPSMPIQNPSTPIQSPADICFETAEKLFNKSTADSSIPPDQQEKSFNTLTATHSSMPSAEKKRSVTVKTLLKQSPAVKKSLSCLPSRKTILLPVAPQQTLVKLPTDKTVKISRMSIAKPTMEKNDTVSHMSFAKSSESTQMLPSTTKPLEPTKIPSSATTKPVKIPSSAKPLEPTKIPSSATTKPVKKKIRVLKDFHPPRIDNKLKSYKIPKISCTPTSAKLPSPVEKKVRILKEKDSQSQVVVEDRRPAEKKPNKIPLLKKPPANNISLLKKPPVNKISLLKKPPVTAVKSVERKKRILKGGDSQQPQIDNNKKQRLFKTQKIHKNKDIVYLHPDREDVDYIFSS